jgi:hypothetical protein
MDWMYQHENVYRLYGLDVSTRKRVQVLWTGCINMKTYTGSMDWMYQHENTYRLCGLEFQHENTYRLMDRMYQHEDVYRLYGLNIGTRKSVEVQ